MLFYSCLGTLIQFDEHMFQMGGNQQLVGPDQQTFNHGNLRVTPPMPPPPGNKALLRDYENPLVSLNKALLGPYFLGGVA